MAQRPETTGDLWNTRTLFPLEFDPNKENYCPDRKLSADPGPCLFLQELVCLGEGARMLACARCALCAPSEVGRIRAWVIRAGASGTPRGRRCLACGMRMVGPRTAHLRQQWARVDGRNRTAALLCCWAARVFTNLAPWMYYPDTRRRPHPGPANIAWVRPRACPEN